MSLWISSINGSFATLPADIAGDFYESDELTQLKKLALPYKLNYESLEDSAILTFGNIARVGANGLYADRFMSLSQLVKPSDFLKKKEKEELNTALGTFLEKLPKKYKWVKELEWSKADTFIRTFS